MKVVNLSQRDRALLKIAANNSKGRDEDLFLFLKVGVLLDIVSIPSMLPECDEKRVAEYRLEDAEFAFVGKLFRSVSEWPYAWADAYVALKSRLDAARDVDDEKPKGKR
jgi:hypothetical protein